MDRNKLVGNIQFWESWVKRARIENVAVLIFGVILSFIYTFNIYRGNLPIFTNVNISTAAFIAFIVWFGFELLIYNRKRKVFKLRQELERLR